MAVSKVMDLSMDSTKHAPPHPASARSSSWALQLRSRSRTPVGERAERVRQVEILKQVHDMAAEQMELARRLHQTSGELLDRMTYGWA